MGPSGIIADGSITPSMLSPEVSGILIDLTNRITALEALNSSVTLIVTPLQQQAYVFQWVGVQLNYDIIGGSARWYIEMQEEGADVVIYDGVESLPEQYFVSTCINQDYCYPFNFHPTGKGATSLGIRTLGSYTKFRFKLLLEDAGGNLVASSPLIEVLVEEL